MHAPWKTHAQSEFEEKQLPIILILFFFNRPVSVTMALICRPSIEHILPRDLLFDTPIGNGFYVHFGSSATWASASASYT